MAGDGVRGLAELSSTECRAAILCRGFQHYTDAPDSVAIKGLPQNQVTLSGYFRNTLGII